MDTYRRVWILLVLLTVNQICFSHSKDIRSDVDLDSEIDDLLNQANERSSRGENSVSQNNAPEGEYESVHIPRLPDEGEAAEPKYGGREVDHRWKNRMHHGKGHGHHSKHRVHHVSPAVVKAKVDPEIGGQKETLDYSADQISKNVHHTTHKEGHVNVPQNQPAPAAMHLREHEKRSSASMADVYFLAIVAGCSVAGLIGLIFAGVCWYKLQKNVKAASEAEYPAYGVTGPNKERVGSPGDRKLAQSAQMYHYQHQKQQMIAMEKANGEMKNDGSDEDSEEENEEGDYTVYECPGLAPTGEMEVKNPLFSEDNTPVTPATPATPATTEQHDK